MNTYSAFIPSSSSFWRGLKFTCLNKDDDEAVTNIKHDPGIAKENLM